MSRIESFPSVASIQDLTGAAGSDALIQPRITAPRGIELEPSDVRDGSFVLQFIDANNQTAMLRESFRKAQMQHSGQVRDEFERRSKEITELVHKNAEAYAKKGFWDLLKKISTYIFNSLSVLLGIGMATSGIGSALGLMMIASGVAGITNQILIDIGGWEWVAKHLSNQEKTRRLIETILPLTLTIICAVASTAGSALAFARSPNSLLEQVVALVPMIGSVVGGAIHLGGVTAQYDVDKRKTELDANNDALYSTEQIADLLHEAIKRGMELDPLWTNSMKETVQSIIATLRSALLPEFNKGA